MLRGCFSSPPVSSPSLTSSISSPFIRGRKLRRGLIEKEFPHPHLYPPPPTGRGRIQVGESSLTPSFWEGYRGIPPSLLPEGARDTGETLSNSSPSLWKGEEKGGGGGFIFLGMEGFLLFPLHLDYKNSIKVLLSPHFPKELN